MPAAPFGLLKPLIPFYAISFALLINRDTVDESPFNVCLPFINCGYSAYNPAPVIRGMPSIDCHGKVGGRAKCQIGAGGHGCHREIALLSAFASPEMPEIGQTALRRTKGLKKRDKNKFMAKTIDIELQKQLDKPQTWFCKYFPARIRNVGEREIADRQLVFDFKDGRAYEEVARRPP